jgi:hypothetical protein
VIHSGPPDVYSHSTFAKRKEDFVRRLKRSVGEYTDMPRYTVVAAFILFPIVSSCGTNTQDRSSSIPSIATPPIRTTATSTPATLSPTAVPASETPTTINPTSTAKQVSGAASIAPTAAASEFLRALINGEPIDWSIQDQDLWAAAVQGGEVIEAIILSGAADRSTVAVSVAFAPAPDGAITDPIGLRLDLIRDASGWTVSGIGYL